MIKRDYSKFFLHFEKLIQSGKQENGKKKGGRGKKGEEKRVEKGEGGKRRKRTRNREKEQYGFSEMSEKMGYLPWKHQIKLLSQLIKTYCPAPGPVYRRPHPTGKPAFNSPFRSMRCFPAGPSLPGVMAPELMSTIG